MRKSSVFLVVFGLLIAGCGKNQVTVEIKGGEGNKVRLDANDLQFKYNFLVYAGSFTFPGPGSKIDLDSGTYKVNVVAGDYLMTEVLELESPPVWDGMAVAAGRLYISTRNGEIVCMGEND